MIEFAGQVVIVTGAGRGLGRLYALELAHRGASVVVNDLGCTVEGHGADPSVADAVVAEIRDSGGVAVASHDSVASPEGGEAIVQSALRNFGRVDCVISNAGIYEMMPFDEIPIENWRRMLTVHLDGAFYLSQPAYKVMKAQGGGRFVFVASSAGAFGIPHAAHYAAAKAGILGLTNNIAVDGAAHGILANSILPFGYTRMAAMGGEPQEGSVLALSPPERVVPMVIFLASRECTFSHRNFSACAGRYARVFTGVAEGWSGIPGAIATAEDVLDHLDSANAIDPFIVPDSLVDEMQAVAAQLGIGF